jgi:hypothetical protein
MELNKFFLVLLGASLYFSSLSLGSISNNNIYLPFECDLKDLNCVFSTCILNGMIINLLIIICVISYFTIFNYFGCISDLQEGWLIFLSITFMIGMTQIGFGIILQSLFPKLGQFYSIGDSKYFGMAFLLGFILFGLLIFVGIIIGKIKDKCCEIDEDLIKDLEVNLEVIYLDSHRG